MRPPPGLDRLAVFLVALSVLLRLVVAAADYRSLTALIYEDDSFYYLQIARNLAEGRGLSFDGTTPTNGFQPLYLLLLVPVMWGFGGGVVAPIHASAVLLTVFAAGSALLLFSLTRFLASRRAALFALSLWAVSPYFVLRSLNGLETGLAVFFALATLNVYVRWIRDARPPSARHLAAFGAIAGLAVLARIDLALLLLALGVDWIAAMRRRESLRRDLPRALCAAGLSLALWLPWGIGSRMNTGAWLPASGPAARQIALNYGWTLLQPVWRGDTQPTLFDPDDVPSRFYADVATSQLFVFLYEQPLLAPLRANLPFGVWPNLGAYAPFRLFQLVPSVGGGVSLALLAAVVFSTRRGSSRLGLPVGLYLLLHFVGYIFYAPVYWYYARYLTVPILIAMVYALSAAREMLARAWRRGRVGRLLVATATGAILGCQLLSYRSIPSLGLHWTDSEATGFLRGWQTLGERVEAKGRIGAFQAGIYGYFGAGDVVNLDGKVNPDAWRALERKELHRYIADRRIDFILDWDWVLHTLCARHVPDGGLRFQRITTDGQPSGISLFRVLRERRGDRSD